MNNEHIESHTDRLLRLKYLETVLRLAENVWLFGDKQKIAAFFDYLKNISPEANINVFNYGSEVSIGEYDVVMPITTDTTEYQDIFSQLNKVGVSPLQIVSPVFFYFPFKAEKEGFIYPVDSECLQFPILATIDTVNACNLDCATCLKPGWQENGERMGVNLFKRILDNANLPSINYHSLRHAFATSALELGFDIKTLSEILGHSSVEVTLNRYIHSSMDRKRACMNLLTLSA